MLRFQRRWLRINLRTLLVLFTLLCLFFSYSANRAHQQRQTLEALRKINDGAIMFDRRIEDLLLPAWLCHAIGDDYFINVTEVHLTGNVTSENLPQAIDHLQQFPKLTTVYLWDAQVTDDDFHHLTKLKQISHIGLHFPWNKVTGVGLKHLRSMDNIREISLAGKSITNDGLEYLPEFASLEALSVGWDGVNDDGLRYLSGCKNLERLVLSSCNCGGPGLKAIVLIKGLKQLNLHNIVFQPVWNWHHPFEPNIKTAIDEGHPILCPCRQFPEKSYAPAGLSKQFHQWLDENRPGLSISRTFVD